MDIEELLEQGKAVQVQTIGNSMTPFLIPGRDEAVLERAEATELCRGDVALYRRGDKLILHRIVKKKKGCFYMVGDSQTDIEGPILPEQIRGKLVAISRDGVRRSVVDRRYRLLSRVWLFLRPIRPVLFRVGHFLGGRHLLD